MKIKMTCLAAFLLAAPAVPAQILKNLDKTIERKVSQRINRNAERAIDKGLDAAEGGVKKSVKKSSSISDAPTENKTSALSASDFVAGEKLIFSDDFSANQLGTFPAKWNTNVGGEVVKLKNQPGKWLRIPDNSTVFPVLKGKLPENFTIEFDLIYPEAGARPPVTFGFTDATNPAKTGLKSKNILYFMLPASVKQFVGYSNSLYSGRETTREWPVDRNANKKTAVALAISGTRAQLYMNGEKIYDLPRIFDNASYRNNFHLRAAPLLPKPSDAFYISNFRLAELK